MLWIQAAEMEELNLCGIVGYIGDNQALPILLKGLKKLEYRGYDSSGVAVIGNNGLKMEKAVGKLINLEEKIADADLKGNIGIGHTRWATHGRPSDCNAHPHLSPNGKFAVVHNGIVENYLEIKENELAGHVFLSETDTEVIAHLLEKYDQGDFESAVRKMLSVIRGAFALVMICADEPDKIIACRKDSPMVLGIGQGENFIASDVPALLSHTKECMYIEENEICILTKNDIVVKDLAGQIVDKEIHTIAWDAEAAEKDGYDDFMLKEIHEQPQAFRKTISGRIIGDEVVFQDFALTKESVEKWHKIYIVACGTAYHAGLIGKTIFEKLAKIPVEVEVASEFRYREPMLDEHTLVLVISQSGETADTVAALREAKANGAEVMAITNVVGSAIARESDYVVYLWAGPEISVASTKAYTTMLVAEYLLGVYFAQLKSSTPKAKLASILSSLSALPDTAEQLLTEEIIAPIKTIAKSYQNVQDLFFIGRGFDWAVALEGALKLKEISYIHAEAYAAGELKHGTLALITEKTPVIALCLQESTYEKALSNIKEVKARDAKVLMIANEGDQYARQVGDACLFLPAIDNFVSPILAIIPLQLISYYTAKYRGCNIDQPRNLAKSVTVE